MEPLTIAGVYLGWQWWKQRQGGAVPAASSDFAVPFVPWAEYAAPAPDLALYYSDPFGSDPAITPGDPFAFDPWRDWSAEGLMPLGGEPELPTPSSGAVVIGPDKMTRGERNNNPGNIVKSSQAWQGKVAGTDSRFESFVSPEYGIRALARVLRSYQRAGKSTLAAMINTYAPPVENNTSAYVAAVSRDTGIAADAVPDLTNDAILFALAKAIIKHENGRVIYSDAQILNGVTMA